MPRFPANGSLSIRYQILLPLLGFLLLAGLMAAITGLVGLKVSADLSALAERTVAANEASQAARDRFRRADAVVARVTAMTDLLDMAPVTAEFRTAADALGGLLGELRAAALSERMGAVAQAADAEARQWRADAEVLLGLSPAREVPTLERMARHSERLRQHFDEAVALAGADARAQIRATEAAAGGQIWTILGLAGVVVLVGSGTAWWLARSLSRPIVDLTAATTRLAEGDTGVVLAEGRRDEIGAMIAAVRVFRDTILRSRAMEAETAQAGAAAERRAMVNGLADSFERRVGGIVGLVGASAGQLQATAEGMSTNAQETADKSGRMNRAAGEAAANVDTVAAAAAQLGASVEQIGRQVQGSAGLAQTAAAEAGRTAEVVQALNGAAAQIGDMVALITQIAGQTNLLALNATIEAARAGEAGRGFAVVAAEVKELANQTARVTEQITAQIARIQGATGEAVGAIGGITGRIGEISAVAAAIAAAVAEQGAATQAIVRNVAEAASGTRQVSGHITGVAQAAGQTGLAADQVLAAAAGLAHQSEQLKDEVAAFLVSVRAA